jgi:hypothetical protein
MFMNPRQSRFAILVFASSAVIRLFSSVSNLAAEADNLCLLPTSIDALRKLDSRCKIMLGVLMHFHDVIQTGKILADGLKSAAELMGSLTALLAVANSMIPRLAKEKSFAF